MTDIRYNVFMNRFLIAVMTVLFLFPFFPAAGDDGAEDASRLNFPEIWAYLMRGEEKNLSGEEPITDLCWFSAELNYKGELVPPPQISSGANVPKGVRMHFVVADISNQTKMHFVLRPDLPLRAKLIADITAASAPYAGVQIDFESIHPDDADNFHSFLGTLKAAIEPKILSVAVPARTAPSNGAFDYAAISSIADRVFIMAYDQHWSGSEPGPVAGYDWCGRVVAYANTVIPSKKLVMGLPFYGRSWQDKKNSRAYRYSAVEEILKQMPSAAPVDPGHPSFQYEDSVKVTVFYDNADSLLKKAKLYHEAGAVGIGFWRIGQEPKDVWKLFGSAVR